MGCDCYVSLPPNVRIDDVRRVLARLYGHEDGGAYTKIRGVSLTSTGNQPTMAVLRIDDYRSIEACPTCGAPKSSGTKGAKSATMYYHFEGPGGRRRVSLGHSYAERIAAGRRLIAFFGGTLVYRDSDDSGETSPDRVDEWNCPEDGNPWNYLQMRIKAVQPLSNANIAACEEMAAYKGKGGD